MAIKITGSNGSALVSGNDAITIQGGGAIIPPDSAALTSGPWQIEITAEEDTGSASERIVTAGQLTWGYF